MRLAKSLLQAVVQPLHVRDGPGRKHDGEPEIDLGALEHLVDHRVRLVDGQPEEDRVGFARVIGDEVTLVLPSGRLLLLSAAAFELLARAAGALLVA